MPPLTNLDRQPTPQQGFGFQPQPRPEYLQALDKVLAVVNDPRNSWMSLGKVGKLATTAAPLVGMPWLYHGTAPSNAANILKEGFSPSRFGENWGHTFGALKGQKGPGVYFSPHPTFAKDWGSAALGITSGEDPAVLRTFIPKSKILDVSDLSNLTADPEHLAKLARSKGYEALSFGNQTVVPDPSVLKHLRLFNEQTDRVPDIREVYKSLPPAPPFGWPG